MSPIFVVRVHRVHIPLQRQIVCPATAGARSQDYSQRSMLARWCQSGSNPPHYPPASSALTSNRQRKTGTVDTLRERIQTPSDTGHRMLEPYDCASVPCIRRASCSWTIHRRHLCKTHLDKREADEGPYIAPKQPRQPPVDEALRASYHEVLPYRRQHNGEAESREGA